MSDPVKTREALQQVRDFLKQAPAYSATANALGLSFTKLVVACQQANCTAGTLGMDLGRLFAAWDQLTPGQPDPAADLRLRALLVSITAVKQSTAKFRGAAAVLSVEVNTSIGEVNTGIASLNHQLETERGKLSQLRYELNVLVGQIKTLEDSVSGWTGFWRGFAEGLSLGIYHAPTDDLDRLRTLYGVRAQDEAGAAHLVQQTEFHVKTLTDAEQAMRSLGTLNSSTVALGNAVEQVSTLAAQTEHDGDRATAPNGKVAEFFRHRFDKDMTTLRPWRDAV